MIKQNTILLITCFLTILVAKATNYTVSTKADLQNRMNSALPGDTITVVNGSYNFGQIVINNNNGTNNSAWIVLRAQTIGGVTFTGSTYLQFSGRRIHITGFRFASGNAGNNDIIQFRTSSSVLANYCRISNIVFDNYNSDSTGSVNGGGADIDNKWVSVYGTNNRVDHCTFINKSNAGATVTIWYNNNNYPQESTSTYHVIDSNYFKGRGYLGSNGGETIRVGTSATSRTNGFNVIAYNLFEDCIQTEPEIISNKSDFNTYCYNTFRNCNGGLTLRHGRYCEVYGNYFFVDNVARTRSYGVRVIDKGHKIYNNYFEGLRGNAGSLTSLRCPIILYNGASSTNDTTNATLASGYFPADSCVVAFNTIVNCFGGAGIVYGFRDGSNLTFEPLGTTIANNIVAMSSGQAALIPTGNTQITYLAEGNVFNAPNGVGLNNNMGFTSVLLNFSGRNNELLLPPGLVQDAAVNSSNYSGLLNAKDAFQQNRFANYDIGCLELNGTGNIISTPVDSNVVGAGKPLQVLSVNFLAINVIKNNGENLLQWKVTNEINIKRYEVEYSTNGINFYTHNTVLANNSFTYISNLPALSNTVFFVKIKVVYFDGSYTYSSVVKFDNSITSIRIYPNPASDFIVVDNNSEFKNAILVITNNEGKMVKKQLMQYQKQIIDVSNLVLGTYFIHFFIEGELVQTQKLIIQ